MGKVLHFTISIPAALVAAVVALSALTLRLPSRLVALYYQEQGARALARALLAEGRAGEGGLWLEPEPLTRPDAQALAAQALERFQAAIAADPANFQAHRWLGRAALLLDRPGDAVAAFSAAVRLRPDNPLGWWELGLAYDHLAPPMPFSWGDRPEEEGPASAGELSQPALIDRTSSPPRRIPAVGVEAPAVESSAGAPLPVWGYARWPLPDAPGGWPGWWVPDEPVPRTVLFAAVPATVTFRVSLPVTPTALVFWMGMDPALQAPQGDGVVYRVWVEDREIFSHTLRPQEVRAGWWPARADLTPWAGRTVRLTLTLDPGPAGDPNGDWAGWGDVQLVEAARAGGVLAGAERRSVAAWRAGGISAEQLVEAGEEARKARRYEEALEWYERAIRLEPGSADGWYHIGVVLQEENQWEQSLYALDRAIDLEPGLARAYIAQARALAFGYGDYEKARAQAEKGLRVAPEDKEILYQAAQFFLEIQDNIRAEELFKAALALDPDNLYMWIGLGHSLFAQKRFDEALEAFKQASLIQTGTWQDAIAHAWLGNTYIALDKPCDALREYRLAAQLHPADSDNFVRLGDAYQRVGETDKALEAYQQALSINPENEWALKRISEIQNESSPGKQR